MKREDRLYGWDDGKIYFWSDEEKKEYCVSDEKELYKRLLKICIEYFKSMKKNK